MRGATAIAVLTLVPGPGAGAVSAETPAELAGLMASVCLSAEPAAMLPVDARYAERSDREIFFGPADRYWLTEDESLRFGVVLTTTARACEFVVDDRRLDPAAMQDFAARAEQAIRDSAAAQGVSAERTEPEGVVTYDWTGTPENYTQALDQRVELSSSSHQTLVRSVMTARRP